jgi:uncharacterized membrane protein YeaQ/YmgE (transglycosylase-associated protein family)
MSKKDFWQGLIIGLLTGIVGNMFVSYLMKVYEYLEYPLSTWIISTIASFLGIVLLVWFMWKRSEERG